MGQVAMALCLMPLILKAVPVAAEAPVDTHTWQLRQDVRLAIPKLAESALAPSYAFGDKQWAAGVFRSSAGPYDGTRPSDFLRRRGGQRWLRIRIHRGTRSSFYVAPTLRFSLRWLQRNRIPPQNQKTKAVICNLVFSWKRN